MQITKREINTIELTSVLEVENSTNGTEKKIRNVMEERFL